MKRLLAVALALAVVVIAGTVVLWAQGIQPAAADPQKTTVQAQKATQADKAADEKAILEMLFDYQEAFNRADAEAVAKHLTGEAELVDAAGDTIHGRDAIRKEFEAFFKRYPGCKLDVHLDWFRWVSSDAVIGNGKAKFTPKTGAAFSTGFTAVYTKKDGKWRMAMVREALGQAQDTKTQEQSLEALDWMVGDWIDTDESGTLKINGKWARNKAYFIRSFTVMTKNEVVLEGTEFIGWDPTRGALRTWVFDSNGGYVEGTWKLKGKSWYSRLSGYQADGKKVSAIHVLTPVGNNAYTFQSISRTIDGEAQPDIEEVTVRRAGKNEK
jgi:uncharacterized protein (TIGR02246 family)